MVYGELKHITSTLLKWSSSLRAQASLSSLQRISSGWFDNPVTRMSIATSVHPYWCNICYCYFFGFDWNVRNTFYQANKIKATEYAVNKAGVNLIKVKLNYERLCALKNARNDNSIEYNIHRGVLSWKTNIFG